MGASTGKDMSRQKYPCHCCNKQGAVYWSEKRRSFICGNCLKTFDKAIIARRHGIPAEQLTLC